MHSVLEHTMVRPSRFTDEGGRVDIPGLAQEVGLDQATLAATLGSSRQSISHHFRTTGRFRASRNKERRKFWLKLDHVLTLLQALTDRDQPREEIRRWFWSPNRALDLARPIDLVKRRELDRLIRMLMDVLNASHGG